MVKEDKYIENRFGKIQPFKAPQGYLDNFADQFMAQLPGKAAKTVKTQHAVWFRMRPAMIAAASVLAVALTATIYFAKPFAGQQEQVFTTDQQTESSMSDGAVEETAFYSMIDNGDIYAILADE
ncbi:MAG: hypothetical protein SOW45_01940 [Prevotella sp.]|nr:hypothetical protein [Prevotellaceae bacterium]MDY3103465.1 hypothetical protein [Prevotella sp.]MDY5843402.1 hypothetical protein [Prevotella sp.]